MSDKPRYAECLDCDDELIWYGDPKPEPRCAKCQTIHDLRARVAALEGALGPLLEAQAKHLDLGGMGSHWVGLTEAHDRARKALEGKP